MNFTCCKLNATLLVPLNPMDEVDTFFEGLACCSDKLNGIYGAHLYYGQHEKLVSHHLKSMPEVVLSAAMVKTTNNNNNKKNTKQPTNTLISQGFI